MIINCDEAQLDIKARGFWWKRQLNYFDIRVTNYEHQQEFASTLIKRKSNLTKTRKSEEKVWINVCSVHVGDLN